MTSTIHAATAAAPLIARRRARADRGMLALLALLIAAIVAAALAAPRLVASVADDGIHHAVLEARPGTDLVARMNAGAGAGNERDPNAVQRMADTSDAMVAGMPPVVASTLGAPGTSAVGFSWPARVGPDAATHVVARLGYARSADGAQSVRWVDGTAPQALPDPELAEEQPLASLERRVEVGVTTQAAADLDIAVGDEVSVQGPLVTRLTAVVTGTYEVLDPGAPQWVDLPEFVAPTPGPAGTDAQAGVGFLTTDESVPDMLVAIQQQASGIAVRFPADPARLVAADGPALSDEVTALVADPRPLTTPDGRVPTLTTTLGTVLDAYAARLAGATAQASVLLLGLVTVGALTLLLAARLLTMRRRGSLDVERARGASVASVVWRALLESVPLAVTSALVGGAVTWLLVPDGRGTAWPALAIVATGVLAPPVLAAGVVLPAWAGRRVPANRTDRERAARRRRTRRLVAELAVLVLAVGAVASVRARGLQPTPSGGVDLLLAATPVLLAAAATLLVVHLLPPVLRVLAAAAARGRSLAALVAMRRAVAGSRTAVPAMTATVAVALVVFCGVASATVDHGQERAADLEVQADVVVDGPVDDDAIAALRDEPGVVAAAGAARLEARTFGIGSGVTARLLAVDSVELARVRDALGTPDAGLAALAVPGSDPDRVPALVTPDLLRTARTVDPQVWVLDAYASLTVLGTTEVTGTARSTPTVVVDRALLAASGQDLTATTVWVTGPGAERAVEATGLTTTPGVTVTTRGDWLATWQSSPLTSGVRTLLGVAAGALALFAGVALLLTVVATSRERRATINVLRTLGTPERTGGSIAFGEVLPTVLAALVAGSAIGVAVPVLLTNALGLSALTGEPGGTTIVVTWQPFAIAVGALAAALVVAVLVEARLRRGDNLAGAIREAER